MVADEMKQYPEIELRWQEVGLSFQVQFIKKSFKESIDNSDGGDIGGIGGNGGNGGDIGSNGGDIGGDDGNQNIEEQITSLILQNDKISVQEIADKIGISKRNCERIIAKLKRCGVINRIGSARTGKWIIRF